MKAENLNCQYSCKACRYKAVPHHQSLVSKKEFVQAHLPFLPQTEELPRYLDTVNYRNKAIIHAQYTSKKWVLGMIQDETVIDIPDCPIHQSYINASCQILRETLAPAEVFPLHCIVFSGKHIVFVLKVSFHRIEEFASLIPIKELMKVGISSLWLHANASAGKKIFHKDFLYKLAGEELLMDDDGIYYHPLAFRQLIPKLHKQSIEEAFSFFSKTKAESILDLYCGIGVSLRQWQNHYPIIMGVEMSGKAIQCAKRNTDQIQLLRGGIEQRLPQITSFLNANKCTQLYVNPPRAGLGPPLVKYIIDHSSLQSMVYLSCNPRSLKYDIEQLSAYFNIENVQMFDFIPFSHHIETQIHLTRK